MHLLSHLFLLLSLHIVVIGEKDAFLVLTLFSHSGVYGSMRRPQFVSRRPDFTIQRSGFHGHCDVVCVSLDNFSVSSFLNSNKIVMAAYYSPHRSKRKHNSTCISMKALQILLLSPMFIHMAAAFIFFIWNSIL